MDRTNVNSNTETVSATETFSNAKTVLATETISTTKATIAGTPQEDSNLPVHREQFLDIIQEMRGNGWDDPAFDYYADKAARKLANDWADRLENAVFGHPAITGDTSDGYHTFNELYHHRAILFSVIISVFSDRAWKSKLHHDGTMYDGMFLVGIETPMGQATYHYDVDPYWDLFECKELDRAPEWDGHSPDDAIIRIASLANLNKKVQA